MVEINWNPSRKELRQFGRFAEARSVLLAVQAASGRDAVARELAGLDADIAAAEGAGGVGEAVERSR